MSHCEGEGRGKKFVTERTHYLSPGVSIIERVFFDNFVFFRVHFFYLIQSHSIIDALISNKKKKETRQIENKKTNKISQYIFFINNLII